MAIGWIIYIEEDTKLKLDSYELVQRKGKSKSGTFVNFNSVTDADMKLESWSRTILLEVLPEKISEDQRLFLQFKDSNQISFDLG